MNKEKFSALLSDYGMILVLLLLCAIFSVTTFEEVPAEGRGAGLNLASKVAGDKEVILIVTKSNDAQLLKEAFVSELKDKPVKVHVIDAEQPIDAKKALVALASQVTANTKIICSKQTGNWTFYSSVEHFSGSEIMVPQVESRSSFLSKGNLSSLPGNTAKTAIIAIGMTMVIITAGIDLSVGSLVALASVVCTLLLRDVFGGEGWEAFDRGERTPPRPGQ